MLHEITTDTRCFWSKLPFVCVEEFARKRYKCHRHSFALYRGNSLCSSNAIYGTILREREFKKRRKNYQNSVRISDNENYKTESSYRY